ncbi:MAG: ribonuclease Z [uncultured Clostridium sp.]
MNIIVCLDDKNGLMFNKRRQSQDKVLRTNIKELVKNQNLFMNEYSYKLYKDIDDGNIKVCENFLNECPDTDFCLIENTEVKNYINNINTIVVYKWNRLYPSDFYFDIDLNTNLWELLEVEEFQGSSHEKITKETYRRMY